MCGGDHIINFIRKPHFAQITKTKKQDYNEIFRKTILTFKNQQYHKNPKISSGVVGYFHFMKSLTAISCQELSAQIIHVSKIFLKGFIRYIQPVDSNYTPLSASGKPSSTYQLRDRRYHRNSNNTYKATQSCLRLVGVIFIIILHTQ